VFYWEGDRVGFIERDTTRLGFNEEDNRGVATLDYNRDGNPDVLFSSPGGNISLYRGASELSSGVRVLLRSSENGTAVGSKVRFASGDYNSTKVFGADSDLLSQDTRYLHYSFPENTSPEGAEIRIVWPDGRKTSVLGIDSGDEIRIQR